MPAERGAFPCSVHPSHKGGRCRGDLECAVRAVAILGSHDAHSARLYLPTSALLGHACRYSTSGRCTASWPIVGVGLPMRSTRRLRVVAAAPCLSGLGALCWSEEVRRPLWTGWITSLRAGPGGRRVLR